MNEHIPHETTNAIGERFANVPKYEYMPLGTLEITQANQPFHLPAQTDSSFDFQFFLAQNKIGIAKNGISKKELEAIKSATDFDYDTLSKILSVSRTTLIKKKGDEKFDIATSERIIQLAEIIHYGFYVFESRDIFNLWVRVPNYGLGGQSPLELLDTLYGMEEVKKELGRIEYGVF